MNKYQLLTESEKVEKAEQLLSMLSNEDLAAILQADTNESIDEAVADNTVLDKKQVEQIFLKAVQLQNTLSDEDDLPMQVLSAINKLTPEQKKNIVAVMNKQPIDKSVKLPGDIVDALKKLSKAQKDELGKRLA